LIFIIIDSRLVSRTDFENAEEEIAKKKEDGSIIIGTGTIVSARCLKDGYSLRFIQMNQFKVFHLGVALAVLKFLRMPKKGGSDPPFLTAKVIHRFLYENLPN